MYNKWRIFMSRIFRFLKSLWNYILYGKRVTLSEYKDRLDKCSRCMFFNETNWECTECGCYVDKKAKMSTEKCPDNRW